MINQDDSAEGFNVVLVDYGMAKEYRHQNGRHLPCEEMEEFSGNLMFASEHTLQFKRPSRRDDFLSLCYIMIYLLNGCDFPFLSEYFSDEATSF
jgi:hypothetical protein